MTQFLRELICFFIAHDPGTTIQYGWAVTTCRRCGEVLDTERLREIKR